jgi:hypothetical protein
MVTPASCRCHHDAPGEQRQVLKRPNTKAQGFNRERYTQIGAEDPKYPTHNFQINLNTQSPNSDCLDPGLLEPLGGFTQTPAEAPSWNL